jgi:hypothetical protein
MFGQVSSYENQFYISGQQLIGVESVELSYSNSANVFKPLGFAGGYTTVNSPTEQKLSISQNLIHSGGLINYTGANNISGSINYEDNSYGFQSGYLNEYIVNCAVGSIPKVSSNITVYDAMVTGTKNAAGSVASPTVYVPTQGSISLTCDNSSTNRVVGFDYSVKIDRRPVYSIGSIFPKEIVTMPVMEYSASVQIDVDDAFLSSSTGFLSTRQNKTVSFTIRSRDNSLILQQLTIPKASLVSESLSSSADGGVKLTLNYIGHS